jgi:hypothetical protein
LRRHGGVLQGWWCSSEVGWPGSGPTALRSEDEVRSKITRPKKLWGHRSPLRGRWGGSGSKSGDSVGGSRRLHRPTTRGGAKGVACAPCEEKSGTGEERGKTMVAYAFYSWRGGVSGGGSVWGARDAAGGGGGVALISEWRPGRQRPEAGGHVLCARWHGRAVYGGGGVQPGVQTGSTRFKMFQT